MTDTLPRKRPAKAPTTSDPVEIAMAAPGMGEPARRLLVQHARLVERQLISENLGIALKVLTGLAGLVVVAAAGFMVWNASRAEGLVIRSFSVPPALEARGVTGAVLAGQLKDRLNEMTEIARAAERPNIAGDWDRSISIQIPNTGLSLGQVDEWLRGGLGRERRVSGEVVQTADGRLALVSRAGDRALPVQIGAETELSDLIVRAAEALYAREQPDTYADFLNCSDRVDEGIAHARARIALRNVAERARGYEQLGRLLLRKNDIPGAVAALETAIAIDERASWALSTLSDIKNRLGQQEEYRRLHARYLTLLREGAFEVSPARRRQRLLRREYLYAQSLNNLPPALAKALEFGRTSDLAGYGDDVNPQIDVASYQARLHDIAAATASLKAFAPSNAPEQSSLRRGQYSLALMKEDWEGGLALSDASLAEGAEAEAGTRTLRLESLIHRNGRALMLARLGRYPEAQAEFDRLTLTCEYCAPNRGTLAALMGDHALSDRWFDYASKASPSFPQGPHAWGRALLDRGEADRAIVQFAVAAKRQPAWADPLSGWGEALLAKGDAKGAAAKFSQAARIAPKWGRNELLWGEALMKLGKRDEAMKHWRTAQGLFLTSADLARLKTLLAEKP